MNKEAVTLVSPENNQESIAKFFEDLGIDNFVDGPPIGAYLFDWGHFRDLQELEDKIFRRSGSRYLTTTILQISTESPKTRHRRVFGSGMTVISTSFGEIVSPTYQAANGICFTFNTAEYREGIFFIETTMEEGADRTTGQYTISDLRKLIGPISNRTFKPGILRRIRNLFTSAS